MPPVQLSFRGSLLTGASALALSATATGAQAQALQPQLPALPPPTWTIWGEGGPSWTGGNSFSVPALPGLGAPYTSFNPPGGFEFAVGADYHPQGQPWHYIFDFRYGQSGTARSSGSSASSSSSTNFVPSGFGPPFSGFSSVLFGTTTTTNTTTSSSTQSSQWERHLVADLMIGRDLGVGANKPEFQVGLRVADLHAAAQAMLTNQSVSNITALTTFYSSGVLPPTIGTTTKQQTLSWTSWSAARWNSRFFGVGRRVAVTGGVPIKGSWSFEYSGGMAGLIGYRSLDMSVWNSAGSAFGASYGNNVVIFNADGFAALSYSFTPHVKASVGIRADYYNSALRAYSVSGAGLADLDRVYWGPFVRLTGAFNP